MNRALLVLCIALLAGCVPRVYVPPSPQADTCIRVCRALGADESRTGRTKEAKCLFECPGAYALP